MVGNEINGASKMENRKTQSWKSIVKPIVLTTSIITGILIGSHEINNYIHRDSISRFKRANKPKNFNADSLKISSKMRGKGLEQLQARDRSLKYVFTDSSLNGNLDNLKIHYQRHSFPHYYWDINKDNPNFNQWNEIYQGLKK